MRKTLPNRTTETIAANHATYLFPRGALDHSLDPSHLTGQPKCWLRILRRDTVENIEQPDNVKQNSIHVSEVSFVQTPKKEFQDCGLTNATLNTTSHAKKNHVQLTQNKKQQHINLHDAPVFSDALHVHSLHRLNLHIDQGQCSLRCGVILIDEVFQTIGVHYKVAASPAWVR